VRLGFFPSSPFFSEFFSSSFCHRISGKERIEIGKGLGRFQNRFQAFFKNLIYYLKTGLQLFYFSFNSI
jgi:hypothetical protein